MSGWQRSSSRPAQSGCFLAMCTDPRCSRSTRRRSWAGPPPVVMRAMVWPPTGSACCSAHSARIARRSRSRTTLPAPRCTPVGEARSAEWSRRGWPRSAHSEPVPCARSSVLAFVSVTTSSAPMRSRRSWRGSDPAWRATPRPVTQHSTYAARSGWLSREPRSTTRTSRYWTSARRSPRTTSRTAGMA